LAHYYHEQQKHFETLQQQTEKPLRRKKPTPLLPPVRSHLSVATATILNQQPISPSSATQKRKKVESDLTKTLLPSRGLRLANHGNFLQ
jgi:hypothetical protein